MRKIWTKYLELLDNDVSTKVFDNIKNLVACAFLFAAGTSVLNNDNRLFMGLIVSNLTGVGFIAVSALLTLLNISDGLRKLAKLRYHLFWQVLLFLLYIVLAERVVEIVWSFRVD